MVQFNFNFLDEAQTSGHSTYPSDTVIYYMSWSKIVACYSVTYIISICIIEGI
jgi:hypothetical protein